MLNNKAVGIIVFFTVSFLGLCESNQGISHAKYRLMPKDFQVIRLEDKFPIKLHQPFSEVSEKLGEPIKQEIIRNGSDEKWDVLKNTYMGLILWRFRYWNNITDIHIVEDNYRTYRGIRIGDHEKAVNNRYGQMERFKTNEAVFLSLQLEINEELTYVIIFEMNEGKVQRIILSLAAD
jgi:hypothetical protein